MAVRLDEEGTQEETGATKLTLRLDRELIGRAKVYSKANGKSISQIVADYFATLPDAREAVPRLTPIVGSLRGVLRGVAVESKPVEDDYYRYLEEKYL
ncbi:MAG TPA: DUF6364 family protein [Thermoanaerobaculia bacterium]|nr:DUF6364 family protein [Thermoanaerobaculia bacterium]